MNALLRHLASCCSPQQPRTQADGSSADELASCMEQLRVADSPARDCSCRSGAISSPRLRSSPAKTADAAATDLPHYRLFTFDIETTGLSPYKDAIIEMAVVDVATGSNWSSLVRPEPYKKSSRDAFNAHGISHYDLLKPGVPTQAAALQALSQFISTQTAQHAGAVPLLVAHNGYAFDFRALAVAVHRQQQALQQRQRQQSGLLAFWRSSSSSSSNGVQMPEHLMVLDTLVIARRLDLKRAAGLSNLQQATVREHFLGAPPSVVHRALADAQELAALLPHLLSWAAAQAGSGLDEKLLPRTFASFITAATTAAAAAAATGPESAAGDEASSSTAGAASAAAGASSSSTTSSSSSSGGTKAAAGRPVAAGGKRGRRKKAVAAAAAGPAALIAAAAAADVGLNNGFAVSDSLRSDAKQRVVSSTDRAQDDLIASVTAAAAIALDISSDEGLLDLSQAGVSSMAVVAAAAVQGYTQVQQDLSSDNSNFSSSTVAVEQAHSSSKIWSYGGYRTSSSSKAESSRVSAVTVLDRAGQQQQQQDGSSSEGSTATAAAHVSHDCAAAAAAAVLSVTATADGTSAQLGPTQSSNATNSSAGSGFATGNTQQLNHSSGIHSCLPAALEDGITSSSSSSRAVAGPAAKARPRPRPRAAGAAAATPAVAVPMFVNIKARSVPIVQSSEFLQIVQASFSNSGSSSSSGNDCPRLQLGPFIPGRSDPSSGFSEVLMGSEGLPVAFLLEGLVISRNIKLTRIDGRIQAGSLCVKPASKHKALQQHIKQVGAAINSLTQLPQQPPPQQQQQVSQQQQQPFQQQQQQGCGQLAEQDLYTCIIGNSLQVKLPVKQGAPYLDTVARQLSDSSCCSSGDTTSNSSGQSSSRRLLPVATPHLAVSDVAERLQQLLPVGAAVSLVLWPSVVWCNSNFRGVTLNCVEVWLQ